MKKTSRNLLLDRLHRGVVYACMGVTLYGTYLIGLRVHRYFTVVRPSRKEAELKMIQEGTNDLDKAPTLRT